MATERHPITCILQDRDQGTDAIDQDLLPLVYEELRQQARAMMAREKPGHTLQATALVHEAFVRLAGADVDWQGRRHFFHAAAESMRRILINQARSKAQLKRGGALRRGELHDDDLGIEMPIDDLLSVDEVLRGLENADPRARKIVNLRFFAGFTVKETAEAMDLSVSTIESEWRFIKAWMHDRLEER